MADATEGLMAIGALPQRVERSVERAWRDIPEQHRRLLENVGAAHWKIVDQLLAESVDDLLRSATSPLPHQ